ncbi:ABC transporter permease [Phytohabitans suffuscus]|uniref:ABC3 transporter permease C-terminal domain-containing protein n=1 Tax=Phytohabitans suffuscus TaxID=624315 RepID=A0A6F8YYN3_9ACTN|nr:FtsX-like permease family protein [Phytohabitans suffuscus]BCB90951.1 hypothetical protein Psuf_082640 [Phytohabitans suffuscus]
MTVLLGARIAFAGGRESVARVALMAGGVAVGVVLLLFSLAAMPALQGRIDRLAWHRTSADSPPTAPDRALWLPTTDWYDGRQLVRVHVAALGARPPVPPGMERLPGPGEVFVSPELATLMASVPADQLADRFPGRVAGTVGPDGLISPDELVAVVGRAPDELRATAGAYEISGIERPGDPIDLRGPLRVAVVVLAVLLIGPVVIFVSMVTRVGAARRERRFAAIRLAGATRWQTGVLAAVETAVAAVAGTAAGWAGHTLLRPLVADRVRVDGTSLVAADLVAPSWQLVVALAGMPVVAVVATLVALHRVQITPLGAHRRARRRPPTARRLVPLAAGVAGVAYLGERGGGDGSDPTIAMMGVATPLSILLGLVLAGPWACMWASRALAALSRRAPVLIAARRIAADPYTAFRAVGGVAIAAFVATAIAIGSAVGSEGDAGPSALDGGVVAVDARGVPDADLAPLMSAGAVVARAGAGGRLVVPCAGLARVSDLSCPLPASFGDGRPPAGILSSTTGFAEPGPGDELLPLAALYVPTDGTVAARERVRTLVAAAAPYALARTEADWSHNDELGVDGFAGGFQLATAFVLLVAACSLTVGVVAGLMERRRPFALLRAAGVRLGELRLVALLETAAPLVLTAAGGMATAFVVMLLAVPRAQWALPGPDFFAGAAAAVAATIAVCLVTWPLMDVATRHENTRFE